ncbi:serine/threonine-protein kinase [Nonomuraea insulae]|uniref:non-specific serine/threonine protein kinase n=1 Tax=Nonomuraea insulae TaxID=1616787 RepID=A0ABW1CWH0_9ACTN
MLPVEDAPGYRVLDQAGQGGFAVVYRAYQERLDRVVALKVLSVDRVDQRTMRRFQRELQLTGRLTGHPNVVTVFDTGVTSSGKPYIAMDFFENGSLRDKIRKEGPLPVPDVLRAGVKLAGALAAVHEAGVLHGDIKPQNILISRYGELAIADFGVARVVDSSEISATSQAFTPLHAAPEVLTGQPHSSSTDIYSLGSTLYHLLAGQPAFHNPADPSIAPLMYRVLSLEPPPINRPDMPQVVFETVLRAMSKQPELRYGSAREFARHLQAIQADLGLSVTDLVGQDPGPGPAMSTVPRPDPADGGSAPLQETFVPSPGTPFPATGHHASPGANALPATGHHVPPSGAFPATGQHLPPSSGAFPATGQHLPPTSTGTPPTGYGPSTSTGTPPTGYGPSTQPTGAPGAYPVGQGPMAGPQDAYAAPGRRDDGRRSGAHAAAGQGSKRVRNGIVIGGAVAVVAIGGTALAVYLSLPPKTTHPSTTTSQQPEADTPIADQDVAALAPRQLKVTADQGALVELRWTLPASSREYPVVLQRSPIKKGEQAITALGQGTTSTRVAGLSPDSGYCFLVGVPLRISENSTVAWSKPTCIRGAVAKSAQ